MSRRMSRCVKCALGHKHPFHDDGTMNEADWREWQKAPEERE